MDVTRPYTALCPTLDSTVLAVLAATTRPLTGREVARLAERRSHRGVLDALSRLAEHGVVDRQEAGRALLFTLNREHLAAPAVELLARMRDELLTRIQTSIRAWELRPVHASLFGSAARADGDTASDVDLFVVRPREIDHDDERWRGQLDELARSIGRWTGNAAAIADVGEADLGRLGDRAAIVAELRRDAITLHGRNITALLGDAD